MLDTILAVIGEVLSHVGDVCELILVIFAIADRVRDRKKDRQNFTDSDGQNN